MFILPLTLKVLLGALIASHPALAVVAVLCGRRSCSSLTPCCAALEVAHADRWVYRHGSRGQLMAKSGCDCLGKTRKTKSILKEL